MCEYVAIKYQVIKCAYDICKMYHMTIVILEDRYSPFSVLLVSLNSSYAREHLSCCFTRLYVSTAIFADLL